MTLFFSSAFQLSEVVQFGMDWVCVRRVNKGKYSFSSGVVKRELVVSIQR